MPPNRPPAYPVAGGRQEISRGLSGTLQGFLWTAAGASLLTALMAMIGLSAFYEWRDARFGSAAESRALADMVDADDAIGGFAGLGWIIGIVVFVLIIIWMNQAHKVSQSRWSGLRKWSSGWTVGAWFIPVANLLIPKLVLSEVERIGAAPSSPSGQVPDGWQDQPVWSGGVIWWLSFVAGMLATSIGSSLYTDLDDRFWEAGYWLLILGSLSSALAGVLGALYVRRITRSFDAIPGGSQAPPPLR